MTSHVFALVAHAALITLAAAAIFGIRHGTMNYAVFWVCVLTILAGGLP